jgi:hypothetical protein
LTIENLDTLPALLLEHLTDCPSFPAYTLWRPDAPSVFLSCLQRVTAGFTVKFHSIGPVYRSRMLPVMPLLRPDEFIDNAL